MKDKTQSTCTLSDDLIKNLAGIEFRTQYFSVMSLYDRVHKSVLKDGEKKLKMYLFNADKLS